MAKQMAFTDASGVEHPEAYFRPVQVNIGVADENANLVFYGYRDAAAREAGRAPIGVHSYALGGEQYRQGYAALIAGQINPVALCYHVATTTADTPDPDWVADPEHPEETAPLIPFFAGATDV